MKPAKATKWHKTGEREIKPEENPIRVIKHDSKKHKTETRVFMRERWSSFCAQPGCKFYGKQARQGICFEDDPETMSRWARMDKYMKEGEELIKEDKAISKNHKEYVRRLEGHAVVYWADHMSHIDGLIWSRRKISLLEHEVARLKKKLRGK